MTKGDASLLVAVSPFVKVPTAKRSLGNGKWEGGFIVPIQWAIPKSPLVLSLTPEIDGAANSDRPGHHLATAQVANLGWHVTPKLNLSAEIWGQWDWAPAGTTSPATAAAPCASLLRREV